MVRILLCGALLASSTFALSATDSLQDALQLLNDHAGPCVGRTQLITQGALHNRDVFKLDIDAQQVAPAVEQVAATLSTMISYDTCLRVAVLPLRLPVIGFAVPADEGPGQWPWLILDPRRFTADDPEYLRSWVAHEFAHLVAGHGPEGDEHWEGWQKTNEKFQALLKSVTYARK
jgi:hypothetical protein